MLTEVFKAVAILDPQLIVAGLGHIKLHDSFGPDLIHVLAKSYQLSRQVRVHLRQLINPTVALFQLASLLFLFFKLSVQETNSLYVTLNLVLFNPQMGPQALDWFLPRREPNLEGPHPN